MAGELSTIINNASETLNTAGSNLTSALTALNSAIAGSTTFGWTPLSGANITGDYETVTDNPLGLDFEIKAAMVTLTDVIKDISLPSTDNLPVVPGAADVAPVWEEEFWTNLKTLLTTFTNSITASDDIDTVVTKLSSETDKLQVALYAADRERKQQTLRDAFSAADSAVGARGFSYPNSMTTALKLAAQQMYMFDLSQTSRDLIKMIFEWAKSNYQFTVERQLSAHTADVEFNVRYNESLVRVYEAEVRSVIDLFKAELGGAVEKLDAKVKEYGTRLAILKGNTEISAEKDRLNVQVYANAVQENIAMTQATINTSLRQRQTTLETALASVQAAASMAQAASNIAVGVANG